MGEFQSEQSTLAEGGSGWVPPPEGARFIPIETVVAPGGGERSRAYDTRLHREVLRLRIPLADVDHARARAWIRAARTYAGLSHPNLAAVYDVDEDEGAFIVTSELPRTTLDVWVRVERPHWRALVSTFVEAGRGLAAAHEAGLAHGRVRASAIICDGSGSARLGEFAWTTADRAERTRRIDVADYCRALQSTLEILPGHRRAPEAVLEVVARGVPGPDGPAAGSLPETLAALEHALRPPTHRARWLVLGLVAVAGTWLALPHDPSRCSDPEAKMQAVWSDGAREALSARFAGFEADFARGVERRVTRRIDAYAQAWSEAYRQTCQGQGAEPGPSFDRAMGCLERARADLDALVGVLVDADADLLEAADALAGDLPLLERCRDAASLEGRVAAPKTATEAARVERLRSALADAKALTKARHLREAAAIYDELSTEYADLGYLPALVELRLAEGNNLAASGKIGAAVQQLRQGADLALRSEDWPLAARVNSRTACLVGVDQSRLPAGLALQRVAEGITRGADVSPELRAAVTTCRGKLEQQRGAYESAKVAIASALELRLAAFGPEHPSVIASRGELAGLLRQQGRLNEARAEQEAIIEACTESFGTDHPRYAHALLDLAQTLGDLGHLERAEQLALEAERIFSAALGPDRTEPIDALLRAGLLQNTLGRAEEAETTIRGAIERIDRGLPAEHPMAAGARNDLAVALQGQGRQAEAEAEYRKVLAMFERTLGPGHPNVAGTLNNIGNSLREQGHREAAAEAYQRAARIWRNSLGRSHPQVSMALRNLALTERLLGRLDESEAHYREALELRLLALEPGHPDVLSSRGGLATILCLRGKYDEGVEEYEQVLRSGTVGPRTAADAKYGLARCLLDAGIDAPRAHALATEALTDYEQLGPAASEDADQVRRWLTGRPTGSRSPDRTRATPQ